MRYILRKQKQKKLFCFLESTESRIKNNQDKSAACVEESDSVVTLLSDEKVPLIVSLGSLSII